MIGVSGGADSLALLDLAARCRVDAVVAHLDHGWRRGSADDARFVGAEAARRGYPLVAERLRATATSEAAGRDARLSLFAQATADHAAIGVLLGHTADDQAETVLLHLLRGSGLAGLAGMRPTTIVEVDGRALRIVRPLLRFGHDQLVAYCRARRLSFRDDPSNTDPRYLRNRVRHELLPLLAQLQPRATEALARLADVAADEAALLQGMVDLAWRATVRSTKMEPRELMVDRRAFATLAEASQRAVLRRAAHELLGVANEVGLERIEAARVAIAGQVGGLVVEWPGPLRIAVDGGVATFKAG